METGCHEHVFAAIDICFVYIVPEAASSTTFRGYDGILYLKMVIVRFSSCRLTSTLKSSQKLLI